MSFSQAFQKARNNKGEPMKNIPTSSPEIETNFYEIPMMYRAQISGRCSLHLIKNNKSHEKTDLDIWTEELVNSKDESKRPYYQYQGLEEILQEGNFLKFKLAFPFRVVSNCGQDSILRPVIDGRGIPMIPGSSIKGIFRRACQERDQKKPAEQLTDKYCGNTDQPGILRFHPAYPLGDWASIKLENNEPSYKILDVVYPQQPRQVEENNKSQGAFALVSFAQPTFIFSITSSKCLTQEEWNTIKGILKTGLSKGLGGKTSSGYGLPFLAFHPNIQVRLIGTGITSVLLTGEPEFRPNLFKAVLRGHTTRLLAGCSNDQSLINRQVNDLFGSTQAPSKVDLYCDIKSQPDQWDKTFNNLQLDLYLKVDKKSVNFLETVLKFAYTMGGFGKSWRRVWHKDFYPDKSYKKLIGCHWRSNNDWIDDIKSEKNLKTFLDSLEIICRQYLSFNAQTTLNAINWRESWHKERVSVYSKVVEKSAAIELFHDPTFKTTPAIGGRKPGQDRPTFVSSVWHRMLPTDNNQYLEIVTIFHGDSEPWKDQLKPFVERLTKQGLTLTWGKNLLK